MDQDHYDVLGVSPTADFETIRRAFRAKVMECHPDRGGNHAQMVRVNAAWCILSDPEMRRRHDLERQHPNDQAIQVATRADSARAQQAAEAYPKNWRDVESWLDSVAKDFTEASYDFSGKYPEISNSASGPVFVLAGCLLGAAVAIGLGILSWTSRDVPPAPMFSESYQQQIINPPEKRARAWGESIWSLGILFAFFTPLGAYAGARLHRWVGSWIPARTRQPRRSTATPPQPAHGASMTSVEKHPATAKIIACSRCGQKLRIPAATSELVVKCGRCGHRFDHIG